MKSIYYSTILLCILIFCASCSNQEYDDYKKFAKDGEILYPEKMDSVKAFSGHERVKISGIVDADPKVSEFRVFWNNNTDSVSVPVTRGPGVDTLEVIIEDIEENIYNFEVRTYDEDGNRSLAVNVTGRVYGDRYLNSLNNRPMVSNVLVGSNLTVNYASMDLSTGVIGTEIDYTSVSGEERTKFVSIDSSQASINDFLSGSTYNYRTVFIPEENAIDTFYTDYKSVTPVPEITKPPYFKNARYPFEIGDDSGGRWNTPADWIHNVAALSHNGYGALDGDLFDLESGWGQPDIINGKVYQTFVLEPGTYAYQINIKEYNYEGDDSNKDHAYFTVAEGATLPDVGNVETSNATLAYERINKSKGLNYTLTFTITEVTQVSVGVETTNDQGAGRYLKINSFALAKIAQSPYLENSSAPFEIGDEGSRWHTPSAWFHNVGALSHGGFGTIDSQFSSVLALESGWGSPNIVNGKVYQTFALEAGTYTFKADIGDGNYNGEGDQAYLTVAHGAILPDVSEVETSGITLAFEKLINLNNSIVELTFTLDQITVITVGFQTTNEEGLNKFLRFNSFELIRN